MWHCQQPSIQPEEAPSIQEACHWAKGVQEACHWAKGVLEGVLDCGGPRVVVFDVDDTLLRNPADLDKPEGISPVINLLHWCRSRPGLKCVIVTARPEGPKSVQTLIQHFQHVGITGHLDVYLRPSDVGETTQEVRAFKENSRRDAETKWGSPVALTVGDRWWDVAQTGDDIDELDTNYAPNLTYHGKRPGGEAWVKLAEAGCD